MRRHCSSVISSNAALKKIPALLTRISTVPNVAQAASVIASTSARSVTSVRVAVVWTPNASHCVDRRLQRHQIDIRERKLAAFFGETQRNRLAIACRCAGDNCSFTR